MKKLFIFIPLLMAAQLTLAASGAKASLDKPSRIHVASYKLDTEDLTEEYEDFPFVTDGSTDRHYDWHWDENSGGGGSSNEIYSLNALFTGWEGHWYDFDYSWPSNSTTGTWFGYDQWMDSEGEWQDPSFGSHFTNAMALPFILWEHCEIGTAESTTNGSHSASRTAQTQIKLQTGGKALSKRKNLFRLTVAITPQGYDVLGNFYHVTILAPPSVPLQDVEIMGKHPDTNGVLYVILSDNDDVDVTPDAPDTDDYSFTVEPQKYHCYFTAYAEEPNPGHGKWALYYPGEGFGHAWWSLSTDAPTEGLRTLGVPYLHYIGGAAGYFPTDQSIWLTLIAVPGTLIYPNGGGTETVHRRREIGINGLIEGLNYTEAVGAYPNYYDLYIQNCTIITVKAGEHAGVKLPNDTYPQNFGIDLSAMPPDE